MMTKGYAVLGRGAAPPPGDWADRGVCRLRVRAKIAEGEKPARAQASVTAVFYPPGGTGKKVGRPRKNPPLVPEPEIDPYEAARGYCAACPVQAECLAYALEIRDAQGFRAGLTPDELGVLLDRGTQIAFA